ncbi:DUF4136 domain-containing protein [Tsuneonella sp. YG55]|uniref:DUF4136 domain-containing protein n=1 Tax=Tsuneonella litorea TaxID=2976475 RepID=A0A9X2VYG8_9SPHN|nr:DUF4136 domain-containing protein [Tsuneonella litorea]MCT2557451.1 DUF4136 domain-containing protein [Tsuneonella litorea]
MNIAKLSLTALAALALAAPAAATEVEVTRFHTAESLAGAAPGPIAVRAGAGMAADALETQVWLDAVAAALVRQGFTIASDAPRVAEVSLDQAVVRSEAARSRSGVSIGVGAGSGGGWYGRRSGVNLGLGLGFRLGGKSGDVLDSTLSVAIVAADGARAWEGRAEAAPRVKSKDAATPDLANEMAEKLFSGFPGESGATIGAR